MDSCRIKICGLSRFRDILAVNEAMPDYIGFVFAKSSRQITPDRARQLKRELNPQIQSVGVFVNASIHEILTLTGDGEGTGGERIIDMIQLHGDEDEAYVRRLKSLTGVPVIKAVRVQSREQIEQAGRFPCDYLLLDTYAADTYGGAGAAFDWTLIPALSKPYFLAGGLHRGNLLQAAARGPFCLDVSSGAETEGRKDPLKIKELVHLLRSAGGQKESKGE